MNLENEVQRLIEITSRISRNNEKHSRLNDQILERELSCEKTPDDGCAQVVARRGFLSELSDTIDWLNNYEIQQCRNIDRTEELLTVRDNSQNCVASR